MNRFASILQWVLGQSFFAKFPNTGLANPSRYGTHAAFIKRFPRTPGVEGVSGLLSRGVIQGVYGMLGDWFERSLSPHECGPWRGNGPSGDFPVF